MTMVKDCFRPLTGINCRNNTVGAVVPLSIMETCFRPLTGIMFRKNTFSPDDRRGQW